MDSRFYRFLERLSELMTVNILFLIGCAGIITIGPSVSAMYTVLLRMVRKETGYIGRDFWKAFRRNFGQAVILECMFAAAGVLLYFDIILSDARGGMLGGSLKIFFLFLGMLYVSVLSYVFAVQCRFENTLWNILKNSFWMAVGYLPFTVSVVVIELFPAFLIFVRPTLFWYFLPLMAAFGFAGVGYACAHVFHHIFKRYEQDG